MVRGADGTPPPRRTGLRLLVRRFFSVRLRPVVKLGLIRVVRLRMLMGGGGVEEGYLPRLWIEVFGFLAEIGAKEFIALGVGRAVFGLKGVAPEAALPHNVMA